VTRHSVLSLVLYPVYITQSLGSFSCATRYNVPVIFCTGPLDPCHVGDSGATSRAAVVRDMKERAGANPFSSAYTIAESFVTSAQPAPNQRSVQLLGRIGNRHRQQRRTRHPVDLEFELQAEHVASQFTVADVMVGIQRHFGAVYRSSVAAVTSCALLVRGSTWCGDRSAALIQRCSIHAFVRVDDAIKQVPLAFVVMSRRALITELCSS